MVEHIQEPEIVADEYVNDRDESGMIELESQIQHYKRRIFSSHRFSKNIICWGQKMKFSEKLRIDSRMFLERSNDNNQCKI